MVGGVVVVVGGVVVSRSRSNRGSNSRVEARRRSSSM